MGRQGDTLWCDGCGVEILCEPVVAGKQIYCCKDCQSGLPCTCGDRMEMDEVRQTTGGVTAGADSGY